MTRAAIYHGWYVVACAFLVALAGWGFGFYGPGVYRKARKSAASSAWSRRTLVAIGAQRLRATQTCSPPARKGVRSKSE